MLADRLMVILAIGGAFLLLGMIFVAIGTTRVRRARHWVSTTGQVINRRGDPLAGTFPARHPTFRWRDASGAEYRHTSSVYSSFGPRPGKLVPVKYDPQSPSRAVIDTFVQSGRIFTVIGIVIPVVGIFVGSFVWVLASAVPSVP